MTWLRRGAIALACLVLLLLVLAGAGLWWLRTGVPAESGTVALDDLSAPVRIYRDGHGIPTIFAETDGDAYFALGWLHAQDRLWQMELQRRVGAGRLAELVGESGLRMDKFMRTLGIYRLAEADVAGLSAETRAALDRYAAGVNAWIAGHDGALPPEFYLLGARPEPWRPADTLVWSKLMALQLSANYRDEILRTQVIARLGPDRARTLFPDLGALPPATLSALDRAAPMLTALAEALPPPLGPRTASNEWVVGPGRTGTGAPILANDPHLGLSAPILWYLARIETPTLSIAGATVPGVPLTLLGQNRRIAWGFTTTGADVQDLFVETVDPADPNRYRTPEGSAAFETRTETIAVSGGDPVTWTIRSTRHGPVLSDLDPGMAKLAGDGKVVALAFAALAPGDTSAEAVYRLNRAGNWQEFLAAMRQYRAPIQNVAYADGDGNIGFLTPGAIPIRRSGHGELPADGASGAQDWTGTIPFEGLPQALNPRGGFIANANNPVVGPGYPYYLGDGYDEPYRARRIVELLEADGPHTVERSQAMQADTLTPEARDLLPLMADIDPADDRMAGALTLLRGWNLRMDRNRSEPLIYMEWLRRFAHAVFDPPLGPLAEDYLGLHPAVLTTILTRDPSWCGDAAAPPPDCKALLRRTLGEALDALAQRQGADMTTWRWGAEHVAPLTAQVLSRVPVIGDLISLAVPTDGGPYTLNRAATNTRDAEAPFADRHGAGYRAVYDLADRGRSRFMIATGQSGHPLSPHWGDLVADWRDGRYLTLSGGEADLAAAGASLTTLQPRQQ
ncbi:penicillin acylase family protein [Inquilinus limosus]|uniref:penicillin acylase family protein n=1 Tax=Inquilinus limosus TaxID=171674 RepID=UPI0003F85C6B|nr:penicillin acylase family protein [Inquilinus limosus]